MGRRPRPAAAYPLAGGATPLDRSTSLVTAAEEALRAAGGPSATEGEDWMRAVGRILNAAVGEEAQQRLSQARAVLHRGADVGPGRPICRAFGGSRGGPRCHSGGARW
jgi:hypothetical protein